MTCIHGDPTCPCQDGDACHYEACPDAPTESGKNPMRCPTSGVIGCTSCGHSDNSARDATNLTDVRRQT